jgi:NAD(P)-dependent dehydrogenase (short-subunit alcohol dehydrogenase family)
MGYQVAINGVRDEKEVEITLEELKVHSEKIIYCQGNIADKKERTAILKKVLSELGHLNVLVNNAGIAPKERKDLLEMTEESYERVMKTNLQGPFFLTQEAARHMIEKKKEISEFDCCIINISSISATAASINRGEYCISKAGMSMMTMLYAVRLGEYDIPVYEIRPGIVETDMTSKVKAKYDKLIEEDLCIQKRWGKPEDVGKAVSALVSGNLPYSTGQVIMVDGGLSIQRL